MDLSGLGMDATDLEWIRHGLATDWHGYGTDLGFFLVVWFARSEYGITLSSVLCVCCIWQRLFCLRFNMLHGSPRLYHQQNMGTKLFGNPGKSKQSASHTLPSWRALIGTSQSQISNLKNEQ